MGESVDVKQKLCLSVVGKYNTLSFLIIHVLMTSIASRKTFSLSPLKQHSIGKQYQFYQHEGNYMYFVLHYRLRRCYRLSLSSKSFLRTSARQSIIKLPKQCTLHYAPKSPKPHNQSTFILLEILQPGRAFQSNV